MLSNEHFKLVQCSSHATQKIDGCGLASAVVTQEREYLTFMNAEADAIHCQLIMRTLVQSVLAEHFDEAGNLDNCVGWN